VKVHEWVEKTNMFLAGHSASASTAFMLVTDAELTNTTIHSGGRQYFAIGSVQKPYQELVVHLENLRKIIVKPEAYF